MARLLRDLDYLRVIQEDDLSQIINSNSQVKLDVEQSAQSEMISYLAQRYKVADVFSNTTVFDITATYKAKNLVEYTADAYVLSSTYASGDLSVYQSNIYECNTNGTTGAWNASKWDYVCADKALFYVNLPELEWDAETSYIIGDEVWYGDKVYTCAIANKNVLPTESAYWGTGVAYSITGEVPTNTTYWTAGDNRNQQIVLFLLDITLYHLYSRINPRNVPDLRKERYNGNGPNDVGGAIGWLKSVAKGNVMADLPVYTPQQGMSMRSGSAGTYTEPSSNMLW